ncbi:MAG: phosphoribosylanthranilate isomerase [Thermoanaerobaculaceae bacterium]|nr:phosphoribosylanthranilate isomerase [Thermoanaerobaculaceae bacterium]
MRVTVKICGLTNLADARAAVAAGADFVGFLFDPGSRRFVGPSPAWIRGVEGASKVGVFRNQDVAAVARAREAAALDVVQLHGDEPPEACAALGGPARVIKAVSVSGAVDWAVVARYARVARILFDTASAAGGGTGRTFDWDALAGAPAGLEFWLAGGLDPENVAAAVARVRPAGVDVASGVEAAVGRKDAARMRAFVAAARGAGRGPAAGRPAGGGGTVRRAGHGGDDETGT